MRNPLLCALGLAPVAVISRGPYTGPQPSPTIQRTRPRPVASQADTKSPTPEKRSDRRKVPSPLPTNSSSVGFGAAPRNLD